MPPPGEWWDYKSRTWKRDRLRTMEVWADAHSGEMTPQRWDRLVGMQSQVEKAQSIALDMVEMVEEVTPLDFGWLAGLAAVTGEELEIALGRLYRTRQVQRDYVGLGQYRYIPRKGKKENGG